jgi:ADP-heptose:LPS heptosyltransferase
MKSGFIYLVRKKAIGDVLWIEPVIRELATRYKKVIVFTKFPELFLNYPLQNVRFISRLNIFEKILIKTERFFKTSFFSINLNKSYEEKPLQHFLNAYQAKAGLPVKHDYPFIYLSEEEKKYEQGPIGKYVVLHIEESVKKLNTRRIYGINWVEVVNYLINKGYQVIEVGSASSNIPGTIFMQTPLRELICLINKSSFFIGIDSGPAHIAVSLKKPVVLFFGSVNPAFRFFPEQVNGFILQHYCEFAGCYHLAKEPLELSCRIVGEAGVPPCANFSSAEVIAAVEKLNL